MGVPSPAQLGIILVICIVIFGGKKITNLLSDTGSSIAGFKKAMKEIEDD